MFLKNDWIIYFRFGEFLWNFNRQIPVIRHNSRSLFGHWEKRDTIFSTKTRSLLRQHLSLLLHPQGPLSPVHSLSAGTKIGGDYHWGIDMSITYHGKSQLLTLPLNDWDRPFSRQPFYRTNRSSGSRYYKGNRSIGVTDPVTDDTAVKIYVTPTRKC